jgi:hypothetical protein
MMGLLYLAAAAVYLTLMFFVVRWAWRKGRSGGGSMAKASAFAFVGFLAVYLPVFWNHIPTVLTHRSMCAKEAGFKALVPAEQWRAQHAAAVDAVRQLPRDKREKTSSEYQGPDGFRRFTYFGGLLANDFKGEAFGGWGIEVDRTTFRIVDAATAEVLATSTDFRTGKQSDLRFWLYRDGCVQRTSFKVGQPDPPVTPRDHLFFYDNQLQGR